MFICSNLTGPPAGQGNNISTRPHRKKANLQRILAMVAGRGDDWEI